MNGFLALARGEGEAALVRFQDGKVEERRGVPLDALPRSVDGLALPVVALDPPPAAGGRGVDLRALARAVWPEELDLSLPSLARRAGIPLGEGVVAQAEAVGLLFLRLLGEAAGFPAPARDLLAELLPDPGWLPEPRPLPAPPRQTPPHEVAEAFHRLSRRGLDHRPAQVEYALAAAEALERGEVRLLEAGPGTGKTFGYLIPLLLHLAEGEGRAVVATRTRALQDQLWTRDLPFLLRELGFDVPCALLKGRENYLCLRELERLRGELLPREILVPLLAWAARTGAGDLDEVAGLRSAPEGAAVLGRLPDLPWRCAGRACPFGGRCPSRRARERAQGARLVVVNHALLGADLAAGGAILGPYDVLVADEAHALPDALRDALSASLSPPLIPRLLGELRRGEGGLLAAWGETADGSEVLAAWERAAAAHRAFWAAAGDLFPGEIGRYGRREAEGLLPAGRLLAEALDALAEALTDLARELDDEGAARARGLAGELGRLAGLVGFLLRAEEADTVFWYAREGRGLTLSASPVEVGDHLASALWPNLHAGILTSATLSVGDEGAALARELGLVPDLFRAWPSPFSYDRVGAFVLRFLPHPDDGAFPEGLAAALRGALAAVPCRALVLFTSRRALEATAAHLQGFPHLVQGRDGEREALLRRFRAHPPPVALLGLDTLWEGIDLPGEELELLVVARLPFPVPTDPLVEAQAERIRLRGRSPFRELFLPRAVLRLRQGVGRLVRTPTDRGAVLLADPRLGTEAYGETFLRTLPVPPRLVDDLDDLRVALAELFR
ncbi:MAG: ATP-dependent DNA helicase [Candidatus Bipolaricaulota bacterium]|nr:ATP-dependent DNA helicase [Candidatus Bipolaricaulota bacterium]